MEWGQILKLLITGMIVAGIPLAPSARAIERESVPFEWQGPAYRLTEVVGEDGQTYTRVEVEIEEAGYSFTGAPGWPRLPILGRLVALPPQGDFDLELVEVVYETRPLEHPVEPAPAPAPLELDPRGKPRPGGWTFAREAAAYAREAPYPARFATLGPPVWMRDQRLTRLTVTPFRYHPAQQRLDVLRRLRLRVRWDPPQDNPPPASRAGAFEELLVDLVLNPGDLASFRAPSQSTDPPIYQPTSQLTNPSYKILVATEGVYGLDYATLAAAGLPVDDIDPATLRLSHAGEESAAQWEGDGDATFEKGERLLFYARPQPTRHAAHDVYWLAWGGEEGRRATTRSGDPAGLPAGVAWTTALFEENVAYDSLAQGRDGDRWFWQKLKLPDLVSHTFSLPLETPAAGVGGELTLWLHGVTAIATVNPDHHVRLRLNGTEVGEVWWEGKSPYTATESLPAGSLQVGDNSVEVYLPGDTGTDIEGNWVDAIAIAYGLSSVSGDVARFRGQDSPHAYTVGGFSSDDLRVYDVTDPRAPRRVTGFAVSEGRVQVGDAGDTAAEYLILTEAQVLAPQEILPAKTLADPAAGADYVVITHADFETALAPLMAHRAAQGLRVSSVDLEAIYDQFGDGRVDPEAIRAFLAHAYTNWTGGAPQYVLLIGDGTYDPRGYRSGGNPPPLKGVPPYLADVDPWLGETAADNRYADLSGDLLPELRLGRLPVNTADEVEAIVQKILRYETDPLPGGWNGRLVFGADNPSTAGNHHADADQQFDTYATPDYGYRGERVYLSEAPGEAHLYTDAEAAQEALIGGLNQGALLYSYFGHASWHQEAVLETDGYAPLFHLDHIARLTNERRWPVVLHMTCFTGRYFETDGDTLDESLLRTRDVGAVAVWGSSGNGVATGHRRLHRAFFQTVFDAGETEMGAATHAALLNLYASGSHYDLIDTFHLFGDPALALDTTIVNLPFSIFLPIIEAGAAP